MRRGIFRTAAALATTFLAAGFPAASATAADAPAIELGAPFCDNAILQREMPVPVWGWSKPGTAVTVEFAGQVKSATAGADGKWMVKLDPLQASDQPAELVVREATGAEVKVANVLVGEVWMASGQSNMQWIAAKCDVAQLLKRIDESVKAGKEPQPVIREFEVTSVYSALHPIEHATGAWKTDNMGAFSAVATAFAYELSKELHVPVGILNCSFSQTAIQAWVPRCGFRDGTSDYTRAIYRRILETDPTTPEHAAAWNAFYKRIDDAIAKNAELVKAGKPAEPVSTATPGNMGDNRDASWMFNGRMNPVVPYAIRGAIWNQGWASIGEGFRYYDNLHSLIRGWREVWGQGDFPVYYHQFYVPAVGDDLTLNPAAEMRLGAWKARDIPNTGMACQIDITGAIHYVDKALPAKRLALHALKNQYGRTVVADGPSFRDYTVEGDRLIVSFDSAEGGLIVGKTTTGDTIDGPRVVENGADQVTIFYLAGPDRVWHRAKLAIDGERAVLTAPGVKEPRGVAYACDGAGGKPNLYNRAMLPLAPFIFYDHELVLSETWPDSPITVEGVTPDPNSVGLRWAYRRMPLLSAVFRDNAVFQAGMPVTIWGSAVGPNGEVATGRAEIAFRFNGIEKTILVTPGMREWSVTVPPMEASAEPKTLEVRFTIDGEPVHERTVRNIVVGDVWYVAGAGGGQGPGTDGMVRAMTRRAKTNEIVVARPRRYSVCTSTNPIGNRFESLWMDATGGLPKALGDKIHAKTGKPVGIICMDGGDWELKQWISPEGLSAAPSLRADYEQVAGTQPGTPRYDDAVRRYVAAWKEYWNATVPPMITSKRTGEPWGTYPALAVGGTSNASTVYSSLVCCFWPMAVKGIVFVGGEAAVKGDGGGAFGEQLSALANDWKTKFGGPDPWFFYAIPSQSLAPAITKPQAIKGRSAGFEIDRWPGAKPKPDDAAAPEKQTADLVELIVREAYK